ncbi:hypothetical protein [Haloimpatiens lingqiaonensis]|uniref:hypothetical protein n=1 Tax=Haloimpatiens lingqiaonensis TaxID=1380675 RepID=UPI0014850288|nr:hypothetical protein [Haloimpatiens lingqiaonensis]
MNEKYSKVKDMIKDTIDKIEHIIDEESPTGLEAGITCNEIDELIAALDKISEIINKYE